MITQAQLSLNIFGIGSHLSDPVYFEFRQTMHFYSDNQKYNELQGI